MPITASTLVNYGSAPAETDLWTPIGVFLADWTAGITISTTWLTDVFAALTASETRAGLLSKPYRTITFTLKSMVGTESLLLQSVIQRAGTARSLIPLYPDVTELSAATSAGVTTIPCDTTNRRFFVGGYIAVAEPVAAASIAKFEFATIVSISSTSITVLAALASSYGIGTRVWPMIEARLAPSNDLKVITDDKLQTSLSFVETTGDSALPALPAPTTTSYQGYYILGIPPTDWSQGTVGVNRTGQSIKSGVDEHIEIFGPRGWTTRKLAWTFGTRASAWPLLQFFDLVRGREQPFFCISPMTDFTDPVVGTTTIQVTGVGPLYDWNFRPYVAVVLNDGTIYVKQQIGATRAGVTDTITLADALPTISSSNVRRVCLAHLVRFDKDELQEKWITNEVMTTNLSVIEVADLSVTVTLPTILTGIVRSPWSYVDPSTGPVPSTCPPALNAAAPTYLMTVPSPVCGALSAGNYSMPYLGSCEWYNDDATGTVVHGEVVIAIYIHDLGGGVVVWEIGIEDVSAGRNYLYRKTTGSDPTGSYTFVPGSSSPCFGAGTAPATITVA